MSNELREAAENLLAACDELAKQSKGSYVISEYLKASNMVKETREILRKALSTTSPEGEPRKVYGWLGSMGKGHVEEFIPTPEEAKQAELNGWKVKPCYIARPAPQARLSDEDLKKFATEFFYWWWNQGGSSTSAGYDEWIKTDEARAIEAKLMGGVG